MAENTEEILDEEMNNPGKDEEVKADACCGDDKPEADMADAGEALTETEASASDSVSEEDRVKRQMAEFENFRKRTEKEKSTMFEMGARSVIEKLLPVVDNFERGLASITEEQRGPVYDGMNMIYKQLMDELDKMDVKPIEALGQPFDPNLHNAVMQVESEEFESGVVAQELQKGYTHHGSVVRHSMVSVVK